ncbi:MAG: rhodanese-like domain-containing protein [Propionibacteriaceae bacterium]
MTEIPPEIRTVTAADVLALVEQGWSVLDVRNDDEWADARMAGAVHIPLPELPGRLDEVADRVVCVCAVGGRSARAAGFLNASGREAVNLDGGIQAWQSAGAPVEH